MQKSQKTDDLSRSPNRTMLRRTLFLMAVCGILAFLALAARLYILQIRITRNTRSLLSASSFVRRVLPPPEARYTTEIRMFWR